MKRIPFKPLENQNIKVLKSKVRIDKRRKKLVKGSGPPSQLFFDVPNAMKSCHLCGLSFTAGVPDDELLHKRHCSRVTNGLNWSREEEKEGGRASLRVIQDFVPIKGSVERGRIIAINCHCSGKIAAKVGRYSLRMEAF
jgi:N-acetyltransferase